jgi:hypothetical protein
MEYVIYGEKRPVYSKKQLYTVEKIPIYLLRLILNIYNGKILFFEINNLLITSGTLIIKKMSYDRGRCISQ